MTTTQIESMANQNGVANPDFDVQGTFRFLVIPKFLADVDDTVGKVHWRRANGTLSIVAPTRQYDLPADFGKFEKVRSALASGGLGAGLAFIGEDPDLVLDAEACTTPGPPTGYWVVRSSNTTPPIVPWAVRFGCIPDGSYTAYFIYFRGIPFSDLTSDVNLDPYIPYDCQFPLVHGLRKEIYRDRFGVGDNRFAAEQSAYQEAVVSLIGKKELGPRRMSVFCR